jgi:hypothetical protein
MGAAAPAIDLAKPSPQQGGVVPDVRPLQPEAEPVLIATAVKTVPPTASSRATPLWVDSYVAGGSAATATQPG